MSSQETLPYIGSKISLISNSEIRYEGILVSIDTEASTASLKNVKSFGSEGRRVPDIPPSPEIFDSIVFKGQDIKDLTVCEPESVPPTSSQPQNKNTAYNDQINSGENLTNNTHPTHKKRTEESTNFHPNSGYKHHNNYNNNPHLQPTYNKVYNWEHNIPYHYQKRPISQHNRRPYNNSHNRRNRFTVGQLASQPNAALKNELSNDFDFDEANSKFEKSTLNGHVDESTNLSTPTKSFGGYNKQSSFFDNISCESLDRKQGRDEKVDKEKQKALDKDTFGDAATTYRRPHFSYRRGGGGRGGRYRGGYMPMSGGYHGGYRK